jgi:hypothetical protein
MGRQTLLFNRVAAGDDRRLIFFEVVRRTAGRLDGRLGGVAVAIAIALILLPHLASL